MINGLAGVEPPEVSAEQATGSETQLFASYGAYFFYCNLTFLLIISPRLLFHSIWKA